ncbi:CheR family methyltransferase [Chryseolinea soli]|uniref:protein-glutamate O-methyltransferase n=1 Tax=Chryseolinea soli TaxID=2321403 RepID=A0A385T0A8_9BACT|nr:protein-glutamate O-methyltransferase CheR [Chryseolinea soli]AYB34498.1 protein-glutamate O-methyltransferase CheR [Chryseolinea soli]
METPTNGFFRMDEESFARLSQYVTQTYGIQLPATKKSILENHLDEKVKNLAMSSYKEFVDFILNSGSSEDELLHVLDLITTHKTEFFREASHFQFLTQQFLPRHQQENNCDNLKIWSAGCSTGEEPYSLLMTLEEYKKIHPKLTYTLLASDISTRVMHTACHGEYDVEKMQTVPSGMRHTYFMCDKADPKQVKIKPHYRTKIQYKRVNLMHDNYGLAKHDLDIIFCRNVLIYFEKPTQEQVIRKFCNLLRPGGLLFLGHSESVMGMNLPLSQVGNAVYQVQEPEARSQEPESPALEFTS